MSQREIEIILIRQLASYLVMPMFIVDTQGTLVFYNEPAEGILGKRFDETGEMPPLEWASVWAPTDEGGRSLPAEELPLWIALNERRPAHRQFWIRSLDHVKRHIGAVAFPLIGHAERHLGAVVIFWELER
jgi:PAS domain-containing protein